VISLLFGILFNIIFRLWFIWGRKGSKNGMGFPKRRHGQEKERPQFGANRFGIGCIIHFWTGSYCTVLHFIIPGGGVELFTGGICKN
jgi:hypothetical protein